MRRWLVLAGLWGTLAASGFNATSTAGADKAAPTDWPEFRGPKRDDHSPDTGLLKEWPKDGPQPVWAQPATGLGDGFSTVSVAGDKLFTMGDVGDSNFVFALDRATGKKLWETKVGRSGAPGGYKGPRCTPTVDGNLLFAMGQGGEFVCLDVTRKGMVLWRKDLRKDFGGQVGGWGYSESPLVDGEKVIVTPGGKGATIVALNKKNGSVIWRANVLGDRADYSSIVISQACGTRQYVQLLARNVVGVSAKDGKVLWTYGKLGPNTANIPTPIVQGDHVLACAGYGKQVALLKITGKGYNLKAEEVWLKNKGCKHGGMVLVGNHVYLDDDSSGNVYCAEVMSGNIAWQRDKKSKSASPGNGSAALTFADGHLYVRYENSWMTLVEATPDGFKEKGSFKIPNARGPSWPHPVVVGGKLYLRQGDQLHCYNVKQ